jgi:hypothetical protein
VITGDRTPGKRQATVRYTVGRLWDRITGGGGPGPDTKPDFGEGLRGTPVPDSPGSEGDVPTTHDAIEEKLWSQVLPKSDDPIDPKVKIMKPLGEGESSDREKPPPMTLEDALASKLNPYIQNTVDYDDSPAVLPEEPGDYDDIIKSPPKKPD